MILCCTIDEYGFGITGLCEAALADLFVPARAVCVWSTGTSWRADEGTERHPNDWTHHRRGLCQFFWYKLILKTLWVLYEIMYYKHVYNMCTWTSGHITFLKWKINGTWENVLNWMTQSSNYDIYHKPQNLILLLYCVFSPSISKALIVVHCILSE